MGSEAMERLKQCRVILFGVGGVGGFAGEALVRGGIGSITVVDHDTVGLTNLNRQIIALHSTLGMKKVEVFRRRALDINPDLNITALDSFLLPDNVGRFELSGYDYIVDAIDTVSAKIALAVTAEQTGVPLISCMGTGNKLDLFRFRITDVYKTSVCPLARVMRRELKARGVKVTGATVHFVDEGTDTGPILLQKAVEVKEGDTPEILQRRVMEEAEWELLPKAIDMLANQETR